MAPTMNVVFDFGGVDGTPGTSLVIDELGPPRLKFKLADNGTIDESDPVIIPGAGAGPNYSALKHLYLKCVNPDGKTISNIKLWSDGINSLGTGYDIKVGLQFPTKNSGSTAGYEVATPDPGTTDMAAEHGSITTTASIFNYNSASPLAISISEAGNVINLANETSNYFCLDAEVANTATECTTPTELFTIGYDTA